MHDDEATATRTQTPAVAKHMSMLQRLKERVRAGFELDAQQQTKLRSEAAIDRDLARFRSLLGKQLLAADAANGQEDDEDDDHGDDDDEVAADEAAAARLRLDDEDEDEANEGLDDGADGEAEELDTPTERVRMDRASRDAALVRWSFGRTRLRRQPRQHCNDRLCA